jgi:uracil phosphoribosyltransferase
MGRPRELEHRYGNHVHLIDDPLALTLLAKLCAPATTQPHINQLVAALYRQLVCDVIVSQLPTTTVAVPTRMAATNAEAIWRGKILDSKAKVAVVCVARAGIYPSQVCYDLLNVLLEPAGVRQDHMLMNRTTDDAGHVSGAAIHGAKIGGPVDNTTLLIPDPMGATGTTIETLLQHYTNHVPGRWQRAIALNLIITPEYIRRLTASCPGTIIYAYRLDRGLSPADVLQTIPGERWAEERGLNNAGYIIPGGGGFGEIMNNAFV